MTNRKSLAGAALAACMFCSGATAAEERWQLIAGGGSGRFRWDVIEGRSTAGFASAVLILAGHVQRC